MKYVGVWPAVVLNVLILSLIAFAIYISNSPLPLLGLFATRDVMPQIIPNEMPSDTEERSNPIGFVHHQ